MKVKKIMLIIYLVLTSAIIVNAETIKLKECEYTDAYIKWLELSDEEKENTVMPIMCKLENSNKYVSMGSSISGVSIEDEKFDLKDYNLVTSVKNQNPTGACWAFASNASIESNLLKNGLGEYDLSEGHLELATQDTYDYGRVTFNRTVNLGGNYMMTQAYLMNQWGPVKEDYLPFSRLLALYEDNETIENSVITGNKSAFDVNTTLTISKATCEESTIDEIKEYLITNGALGTSMYMDTYSSYKKYFYYDGKEYTDSTGKTIEAEQSINHAVTIVGWDDTISKDKFTTGTSTPSRDGAFIIKNSYGVKTTFVENIDNYKKSLYENNTDLFNSYGITDASQIPEEFLLSNIISLLGVEENQVTFENNAIYVEVGEEGYQYISYDDFYGCYFITGFYNVDNEVEDYSYSYSNFGSNEVLGHNTNKKVYILNYFDKKSNETEILKEVRMEFVEANKKYNIYFADKKTDDITESTKIASGVSHGYGYDTIKLDDVIEITSDTYTIFVELESEEEGIFFPVTLKQISANYWSNFEPTADVQFISWDAINYSPTTANALQSFNIPINVNTNLKSTEPTIPDEPDTPTEDNGDNEQPPSEENKDDETENIIPDDKKDEINTDGKIEIEENDYNKEHQEENKVTGNENVDQTIDNPKTGLYIPIFIIILIGVSVIAIRKNMKSKVYKI